MNNIRLFHPENIIENTTSLLSKEHTHYVANVMRMKRGSNINFFNKEGEWLSEIIFLDRDRVEVKFLNKLKQSNYKLAILSNGTPGLLNELVVSNGLKDIFDDIFSVEAVGIFKPDSKVYDLPIDKYNIDKNEVLFLSANTWDVSGAGNYGYKTVWVNRNNNVFDKLDFEPNKQISNLSELLDLI